MIVIDGRISVSCGFSLFFDSLVWIEIHNLGYGTTKSQSYVSCSKTVLLDGLHALRIAHPMPVPRYILEPGTCNPEPVTQLRSPVGSDQEKRSRACQALLRA